jgi:23S rRNA (cytosine1962-C5)-methyltransferase
MAGAPGHAVRPLEVLDCFCYTGGFAVAAAAGAGQALGRLVCVDSSEAALALARANLSLNPAGGSVRTEFVAENAFDYLRRLGSLSGAGRQAFDLVILDPPPFARERRMLEGALRGYKEINLRAMRLLRPGGYLVTCTCSHHVGQDEFRETLAAAAADVGLVMRVASVSGQPVDHPVLLGYPEGDYLRCLVLQRADGLS